MIWSIRGLISDAIARIARIDSSTHALEVINYEHHEVHAGSHYFAKSFEDFTGIAGEAKYFTFVCPDTVVQIHAKANFVGASQEFEVYLYEAPTITASGVQITPINNDRNSINNSTMLAYGGATVTSEGTLLGKGKVGVGKGSGVSNQLNYEIIAKRNTKYAWKLVKVGAGNAWIDVDFFFYEHTPKN